MHRTVARVAVGRGDSNKSLPGIQMSRSNREQSTHRQTSFEPKPISRSADCPGSVPHESAAWALAPVIFQSTYRLSGCSDYFPFDLVPQGRHSIVQGRPVLGKSAIEDSSFGAGRAGADRNAAARLANHLLHHGRKDRGVVTWFLASHYGSESPSFIPWMDPMEGSPRVEPSASQNCPRFPAPLCSSLARSFPP